MSSASKRVFFDDFAFVVDENVYEPAEDSFLFAENLCVKEDEIVLDMGTGCGMLGIIAAKKASMVVAVDVNPHAIQCAKHNATLNTVRSNMAFIQGDLFISLNNAEKFDMILFNAPYLPTAAEEGASWLERAWTGGATGRQVIDRFISQAPQFLNQTGRICIAQSTLADVDETRLKFKNSGLDTSIIAEQPTPLFETIVMIKATRIA